jgi:PAS domain S-box-containing protein
MTPDSFKALMKEYEERVLPIKAGDADQDYHTTLEMELFRRDGSTIWTESLIQTLLDDEGKAIGLLGVTRDATDRKLAAEVIEQSEQRYRLIAENAADVIFTVDENLEFTYVSPSFQKLTGFTEDELVEMGWASMITTGSYDTAMGMLADNLVDLIGSVEASGEDLIFEMEVKRKDGGICYTEVNLSAQLNADGEFEGFQGVARDIGKRKETERRYLDAKGQAEFYLDIFSHDIININQGIMNYLEVMQQRLGLEGVEGNYVKNVLSQSWRISELITNVQLLTRLQEGRLRVKDVDPEKMLMSVIEEIKMKYENREVEVLLDVKGQNLKVKASSMLHDVFRNVIDNAVKFDRHVKTIVDVRVHSTTDGEKCRFEFADRGPGIPDAMKDNIFHRLDKVRGDVRGTGLGLAVVHEFVKRYGGKVWAEDRVRGKPAQGNRLVIELPSSKTEVR